MTNLNPQHFFTKWNSKEQWWAPARNWNLCSKYQAREWKKAPFTRQKIFGIARMKKVRVPKADIRLISLIQLLHANLLLHLFNFLLSSLLPAKQFKLFSLFLIRCKLVWKILLHSRPYCIYRHTCSCRGILNSLLEALTGGWRKITSGHRTRHGPLRSPCGLKSLSSSMPCIGDNLHSLLFEKI